MTAFAGSGDYQTARLPARGSRLFVLPTQKFRRTTASVVLHTPLEPEEVARRALVPYVLRRGTRNHPTAQAIERRLAALYGASLSGGVDKVGDRQLLTFSLTFPAERYVSAATLREGLSLLWEAVNDPHLVDGAFPVEVVEQEKRNQLGRIRSLIDNKAGYAFHRCIAEMFAGEPFATYALGDEEQVAAVGPAELLAAYGAVQEQAPRDLYVVGDVDPPAVLAAVSRLVEDRAGLPDLAPSTVGLGDGQAREVVEEEEMAQGWLVLGYRTDVGRASDAYYPMLFFHGLLGGFVHSRLFLEVREKASLAYAAASRYDANKGVLLALAGIGIDRYDQAREKMLEQVADLQAGNIDKEELGYTRDGLLARIRMARDRRRQQIVGHVRRGVEGVAETSEEMSRRVREVTREQVAAAARRIRLDTIYFLRGPAR